jgi:hypothetical protein
MIRIDTAPHHRQLLTYPRHIHMGTENNIVEDTITNIDNNIDENVKCVLGFVSLRLGSQTLRRHTQSQQSCGA